MYRQDQQPHDPTVHDAGRATDQPQVMQKQRGHPAKVQKWQG